jgi:hypothetical protein
MAEKKLPIGESDFRAIIEEDIYFVDKSLFIKDVVDGARVLLYPRPRRFGKTLNLSMLRYFYNKNGDNSKLFKDLKIAKEEKVMEKQGKHPVIFLTLKDVKCRTKEECYRELFSLISEVFIDYNNILDNDFMTEEERIYFKKLTSQTANKTEYGNSLRNLSKFLFKYYKENSVILIDEYDTPIQAAFHYGYYEDIIIFMRNFLSGALKDNVYLEKAVLTGILRVSKESIFSGLNNLLVCSILENESADKFGFTESEVVKLLSDFGNCVNMLDIKNWYDGYNFAGNEIYNPWSIIHCINRKKLSNYWANSSNNTLIRDLCLAADETVKRDIEMLIEKGSVKKPIDDNIVFGDIQEEEAIWSFMLMCGYLRYDNLTIEEDSLATIVDLSIPNKEIRAIFIKDIVRKWFTRPEKTAEMENIADLLVNGDIEEFKLSFADFCKNSFSFYDVKGKEPEKFYHGFVLGLLVCLKDRYRIVSNRESGAGRYDVMIIPKEVDRGQGSGDRGEHRGRGVIFEFKTVDKAKRQTFESVMERAKKQIIEKNYAQELKAQGVPEIVHIIAVFEGKEVRVESF